MQTNELSLILKYYQQTMRLQLTYNMFEEFLALNNQQRSICQTESI